MDDGLRGAVEVLLERSPPVINISGVSEERSSVNFLNILFVPPFIFKFLNSFLILTED